MRLLERNIDGEVSLTKDLVNDIPPYAILSHSWGEDGQEVSFDEMRTGLGKSKGGYEKIRFCGEQAARDDLRYFWVDTCCIDKSDPVELQRSINSMFRWYQNATKCYVYLSDVQIPNHDPLFESILWKARWFTRGWTLQELLAPSIVEIFSADFQRLGDKISLERIIHERTEIPINALRSYDPTQFSVDERVSWVAKRETTYEEDLAYSLSGMFGVYLPLLYGEGKENAFRRLREEVSRVFGSSASEELPNSSSMDQLKFTVPFARDPKFIGRENIMQEITSRLQNQRSIALCGIGGIGKSQIAIEYCYKWKDSHPDNHVFWVHAGTFDSFDQAYRGIAKAMSIPGTEDPQADNLVIVRDWLNKPENGSWLLVLDNADDLDLFFGLIPSATTSNHRHISDFLPRNADSVIIVTTRDKRIGQRFTDREGDIMITPLAPRDAGQLLKSKITTLSNVSDEDIQILVEILGNIPLAITQAAAFIQENSMTVQTYIEELKASDSDLQDYLDENLPDPRRHPDSENSVARTWKLSFIQIAKQFPPAANMLSLMVQLDRQAIPKTLLKHKSGRSIEFNKAIGILQAYSLIKPEKDGSSFEIHRLIQLSTQRWLNLQHKQTEWQNKALELMAETFPTGHHGTWKECESLLLHAKCVTKYNYVDNSLLLQRANLLENLARFDESQGRFEAACLQNREVLQTRDSILGKTHLSTLTAMNNLAGVLDMQGKYAEAESISRHTLQLSEEVLGKTHPSTLITMSNLASVLDKQGKYAEAESLSRSTLQLKEKVLGKTHPETLITMSNLASVLDKQGKYAEAESISRYNLQLLEEVLSKTHPSTLITMSNLAKVLDKQGKYAEAESMSRHTLQLSEEVLGKTHPSTLITISNLAGVLDMQGKYTEAESMSRYALQLKEEVLGKTHPSTLITMSNLAGVLERQGKYAEAESMSRSTLKLSEEVLSKKHPDTLANMGNLAILLATQGKYTEAESITRQALQLKEEVLGKTHPDTIITMGNLAYLLQRKAEYEEASVLFERACTGLKSSLGAEHPTTIAYMNRYSRVLEEMKDGK